MSEIQAGDRKLLYQGSVKNLWAASQDQLEFEYTNAYSVFDWGRMPDELSYKGESLAAIGAYFFKRLENPTEWGRLKKSKKPVQLLNFYQKGSGLTQHIESAIEYLAKQGLKHHFLKRSSANGLLVKQVNVVRPQLHALGFQNFYSYPKLSSNQLIPLEVVFRLGMPKGSSLLERLSDSYCRELGFETLPQEGDFFKAPILEFFTKLETTDRFLTWEQALHYSGLSYELFVQLIARSLCIAIFLSQTFEEIGLELWDGKIEWAQNKTQDGPEIILVDSIGPDELRLLDPKNKTQVSKEFLRMFYRNTSWFEMVKEAKAKHGSQWKKEVKKKILSPPKLSPSFRLIADKLYPSLALALTKENPGNQGVELNLLLKEMRQCLKS